MCRSRHSWVARPAVTPISGTGLQRSQLTDFAFSSFTDCVSFKPNSTNILVESLWCNGSHGISVGSLGQYVEEYDIVENVYVANVSMHNASDGARIKVWPNTPSALSGDLQGKI